MYFDCIVSLPRTCPTCGPGQQSLATLTVIAIDEKDANRIAAEWVVKRMEVTVTPTEGRA